VSKVDFSRPGVWTELFAQALKLMTHLESVSAHLEWTFGGGTVLMLRLNHRQSKDIDLFVPDPQYLPYINPRLSDVAEGLTSDYEESSEFIKLNLRLGEIDVVVGKSLTDSPFEVLHYGTREVKVETSAEILAKKFHHRGDQAKARDLFDLCAVASLEPEAIPLMVPFMWRHGTAFLDALDAQRDALRLQFDAIDTLAFRPTFDACVAQAQEIVQGAMVNAPVAQDKSAPRGRRKPAA
jgi:Nucleotidyl transferase AbiEii toxin, Type IV TA system